MKPYRPVEALERRARRRVNIRTDGSNVIDRCHQQGQSPLFALLPRELREMIWQHATAPHQDESRKFEETAYYYRPDRTAALKTDTALLSTCRRVWLESHAMPMLQAANPFYFHRPAPDRRDKKWMATLTDCNRQNLGQLQLYSQSGVLSSLNDRSGHLRSYFLDTPYAPDDFHPRSLRITLRHTDWRFWENDRPLYLEDKCVKALLDTLDLRSTETLILELETLEYKKNQLDVIIARLRSLVSQELQTHIVNGKPAKTVFKLVDKSNTYTWEGPPDIGGQTHQPYEGLDRLKYHIETLTWKLHFVGYPPGDTPHLRRMPRTDLYRLHYPLIDELQKLYVAAPWLHGHPPGVLPRHQYYQCPEWMWQELTAYWALQENMCKQAEITASTRRDQFERALGIPEAAKAEIQGTLLQFVEL